MGYCSGLETEDYNPQLTLKGGTGGPLAGKPLNIRWWRGVKPDTPYENVLI